MKQVADRETSDREVLAAFSTHGDKAASAAQGRLGAHLRPGETMPDMTLVLKLLERMLAAASTTMTGADRAHSLELGDDAPARDARDHAAAGVVALVTSIRLALTRRFGEDFGGKLGDVGTAPRTPGEIQNWGRKVLDALTKLTLPAADLANDDSDEVGTFSKDEAVRKLERRLEALSTTATDVSVEEREAEQTLAAKNDAIGKHDEVFGFTAALLETLLEGAGELALAKRVKPSRRRPGQTVSNASEPTPRET